MASRLTIRGLLFVAATALAACGGDEDGFIDAPRIDAAIDAPDIDAAIDAPDIDAPIDAPDIDAPDIDAPTDGMSPDAAIDAPSSDAPMTDAAIDAPSIDAPSIDAPIDAPPPIDAPIDAPPPLPGDICASAEPITLTGGMASVSATTLAYTSNYNVGTCTGFTSNGPDRVHSITIPAGQRLTVTVVPTAGSYDPGLSLVGGPAAQCDAVPLACLTASDAGGSGQNDTIAYNNTSANPLDVFIIVDGFQAAGDAYTLNVVVGAIPPALPGETCQSAEPIVLTGGTASVSATTLAYTSNYNVGPCTGFTANGPDRIHSITIPAGQRLTASVVPTAATFDPGISVVAAPAAQCDMVPLSCLVSDDNNDVGITETVVYNNTSTNPLDVFLIIDSLQAAGDAYTLNVTVGAIPPAPPGDVCGTAPTITLTNGMATVTGTTVNFNNDYDPGTACTGYFTTGPDSMHQVSVAAGGTLTVTLTPAAAYDAGIYLIAGPASQCDAEPIVCLDGADVGFAGAPEIVTYTNTSGGAQTVFIGVDGDIDLSAGDTYGLQVSVTLP